MRSFFTLLFLLALVIASPSSSTAHEDNGNVKVDSLDPTNQEYLENFCSYHPASSLCFFTPNPPKRPAGSSDSASENDGVAGVPPMPDSACVPRNTPVMSGNVYRLTGQTLSSPINPRLNYDSVLIENNRFSNGRCTAIQIDPCRTKNVIIRNNTFENWSQTGCNLEMIIYAGWQPSHSNCTANFLIENNRFINTRTFKRAIEVKTSNVVIRNNVADSGLEVRHGRNLLIENNSFAHYEIFGDNHILRNNRGGPIHIGDGQVTQDDVRPHSGYPVARNIRLQGNTSPVSTFCWQHSAGPCRYKATYTNLAGSVDVGALSSCSRPESGPQSANPGSPACSGGGAPQFCASRTAALQQMARETLNFTRISNGFKDSRYPAYAHAEQTPRGNLYMRHLGQDISAPIGTQVHALTGGVVQAVLGNPSVDILNTAIIVRGNDGIYWAYGHLNSAVRVGQTITKGTLMGSVADPKGVFSSHVHISALKIPMPSSNAAVNSAVGWGRAYGRTGAEADANADRYAYDPVDAYMRANCQACRAQ
ncbi:MAG: peptidoglycan DD-metalloendopeptidase family protein [Rickettsiales bacterium]